MRRHDGTMSPMKTSLERRTFLGLSAMAVAAAAVPRANGEAAQAAAATQLPVRLGMCSYTFRNFDRAQLINFLKQLEISTINLKDAKNHLPSTSAADEQKALDDYKAAGITPTAVGTVYFPKDEDA